MGDGRRRAKTGLVCGRFLPLHRGHELLIEFALRCVDTLTVLVFESPDDPIRGELRARWIAERFPSVVVPGPVPQLDTPHDAMDYPFKFAALVERTLHGKPECVFSSDASGEHAAMALGATFVPVDPTRTLVPTSGNAIRDDVYRHFDFISSVARPWFVRRIAVLGAESTGKSTLVRQLAHDYRVPYVSEYLRTLVDGRDVTPEDISTAARGQIAVEDGLAKQSGPVLFCDTDLRTVHHWSERLFQRPSQPWVTTEMERRVYDLTLLLSPEVPFVGAERRDTPVARQAFHEKLAAELASAGPVVHIRGTSWDARVEQARKAVHEALQSRKLFGARGERDAI